MNLQNPQYIEIVTNLEMIDRANKAIAFHRQLPAPDLLAIQQYESLRAGYLQQLAKLLNNFEIRIQQPEVENIPSYLFQNETFKLYSNT